MWYCIVYIQAEREIIYHKEILQRKVLLKKPIFVLEEH